MDPKPDKECENVATSFSCLK